MTNLPAKKDQSLQDQQVPESYADLRPFVIRETNEYVCIKLPPKIAMLLNMEDPMITERFVAMERDDFTGEIIAVKRPGVHEPLYKQDPPFAIMDLIARGYANAMAMGIKPTKIFLSFNAARLLDGELAQFAGDRRPSTILGMDINVNHSFERYLVIEGSPHYAAALDTTQRLQPFPFKGLPDSPKQLEP